MITEVFTEEHMLGHEKLVEGSVVFIDEVNFIQPEQVHHLWKATKELDVDVFTYG